MDVLQEPAQPAQLREHPQVRLRHHAPSEEAPAQVLRQRERRGVGLLRRVRVFPLRQSGVDAPRAFSISQGESLCLAAAAFYACTIILTDRLSRRDDPLALGILQVGFIGLYGIVMAFLFEVPRMPATASEWGVILGLAVVCSDFGFTLQPVAQSGTTSERAGLFSALGPLGAALSGYVFLNERLGITGALGMGLILLGMLFGRRPRPHRGRA